MPLSLNMFEASPTIAPLRLWLMLAMFSLVLGSLMAVVLVLSKLPLLAAWMNLDAVFSPALVLHVNFTILLWVGCNAAIWWGGSFEPRFRWVDRAAAMLAAAGVFWMLAVALGGAPAVLSNYVPVLGAPGYLSGLLLFAVAVSGVVLNRLSGLMAALCDDPKDSRWALALAAVSWLVAITIQFVAWGAIPDGALTSLRAEQLFWGSGHVLQAVNLCLLVALWWHFAQPQIPVLVCRIVQVALLSALMLALLLVIVYPLDGIAYRVLFTYWMRFFSLPVLLLLLPWICFRSFKTAPQKAVGLSLWLFIVGAMVGAMIKGDSLLVPAHYHAVTAALNIMLMLGVYSLVGSPVVIKRALRQIQTYCLGAALLVAGLGVSGWLGIGRKLSGAAQGLSGAFQYGAMSLMVVGGLVALMATFWFCYIQLGESWRRSRARRYPLSRMGVTD